MGYETLTQLVRGKRAQILEAWEDEVNKLAPLPKSVTPMSSAAVAPLLDHIADIAERMDAGDVQLSQEAARRHARGRAHEGLELSDVLRDFSALRSAILRCGLAGQAEAERSFAYLIALDRAIDESVIACIAYYHEQHQRTSHWVDRITGVLLESTTLDDACRQALCVFSQAVPPMDVGAVFLRDEDYLRPRACIGPDMDLARLPVLSVDEALVWSTASPHEARPRAPMHAGPLLRHEPIDHDAIDALLCLPLHCAGELIGVLYVGSQRTLEFADDDVRLMTALARRVGQALRQPMRSERAHQALRARDDALAMVSHDLGNPLGAILISVSSLLSSGSTVLADEHVDNGLQVISRAATRMRRILQDLVDFVRSDSGPVSLRVAPHPPAALAREVIDGLMPDARKRGVALRSDVPSDLPDVMCDRERTLQVLWNVVGNALQTTTAGGSVGLRAAARPAEVLFSVSDTGAGMAREDLQHVFDRYRQAPSEGRHRGTGLGLAVARSIVDAHEGGRIWAESEPGAGNKISFTLPAAR